MPFYPGPGLGGHCIPIDPFYLTWKAREYECATRFIELAGEVNVSMPEYVVARTAEELNNDRKSLMGSRILIIGLAYKKDVDDVRESPSIRLIELFGRRGALVDYHDPHVPETPEYCAGKMPNLRSVTLTPAAVKRYDAVVIATNHSGIDYALLGKHADLVVDTRNAMAGIGKIKGRVAKA